MVKVYALVYLNILALLHRADPNVYQTLIVLKTRLVQIKNASIHAKVHAVEIQFVMWSIIDLTVNVKRASEEILSQAVNENLSKTFPNGQLILATLHHVVQIPSVER